MTSYSEEEVDERAFAIFLRQGILYFLDENPLLSQGNVIQYSYRLHQSWLQMSSGEKSSYIERAQDDLHRLRDRATDVFRSAMRQASSQQ